MLSVSFFVGLEPCLFVALVFDVPSDIKNGLSKSEDKLWSPLFHQFTVECFFRDFTVKNDNFFRPHDALFPVSLLEVCIVLLLSTTEGEEKGNQFHLF